MKHLYRTYPSGTSVCLNCAKFRAHIRGQAHGHAGPIDCGLDCSACGAHACVPPPLKPVVFLAGRERELVEQ